MRETDKRISIEEFHNGISNAGLEEFKKAIDNMKIFLGLHIEYQNIQAKMIKAKYNALIAEGFNEKQALYLCHNQV